MSESLGQLNGVNSPQADTGEFNSIDSATGEVVWSGPAATEAEIDAAIRGARRALGHWSATPLTERIKYLEAFAAQLKSNREHLAGIISLETGKPHWEALSEIDAMIGKVPLSIQAFQERRRENSTASAGVTSATRYKPFGVLGVFGPFNMPGHLPNGHIVPALLAGNCVVFKPSELTPLVGQRTGELWTASGLPPGVLTIMQGGRQTGAALVRHPGIDGVLFTGSVGGGLAISRTLVDQPGKIVALEMGGNNPLVVWEATNFDAAAYLTIQSAFITSGQRCSCARRLIVRKSADGDAFLRKLIVSIGKIVVGPSTLRPEPFMGPVISDMAAEHLLKGQSELRARGGEILVEMRPLGPRRAMLSPGLIDVTAITDRPDEELFGPILQVIRVDTFGEAIAEANNTRFGLVAGVLSDNIALWEQFYRDVRAGVVYWNRQTTGGSSALAFGGTGLSGNHRPSGYFAADYCSFPVASMESPVLSIPEKRPPGIGV